MSPSNQPAPPEHDIQRLDVELGERSYPIWIGFNVTDKTREALSAHDGRGAFLVDKKVRCLLGSDDFGFTIPEHPNGETAKSMQLLGAIYEHLANEGIGRDGCLVAVGGGVTGDLGGFAAATYLRGIDFYQVPTTLLAMVDSSVGGKTGINIRAGKNLVGAFWQPRAVFISTFYLRTLPAWEFSAGMAEVIKYGMLHEISLFRELQELEKSLAWDHPGLPNVIKRCCAIKAAIVKGDEKETAASGGRALLNLGHTFAHAIENAAGYGTYLHGEAVAVGLHVAARLSEELTRQGRDGFHFSAADTALVDELLARYHLPADLKTPLPRRSRLADYEWRTSDEQARPVTAEDDLPMDVEPPALSIDKLMAAMKRDKKVKGGKLRFVAMECLGRAVTVGDIDEGLVRGLWREVGAID